MGLRDFTPKTETVSLPGDDSFVVRGLALEDITVLVGAYYDTAAKLFDKYVSEAAVDTANAALPSANFGEGNMRGVVRDALKEAPAMLAEVIARAAGEPDLAPQVRLLPLGTQVAATEAIIRLTLEAEGGMEKLVETINKVSSSLAGLGEDRSR